MKNPYPENLRVMELVTLEPTSKLSGFYLMNDRIGTLRETYENLHFLRFIDTVVEIRITRYSKRSKHFTALEKPEAIVDVELILRLSKAGSVGDKVTIRGRWGKLTGIQSAFPISVETLLLSEFSDTVEHFALKGYSDPNATFNLLLDEDVPVS